jgi:hypothetical protein
VLGSALRSALGSALGPVPAAVLGSALGVALGSALGPVPAAVLGSALGPVPVVVLGPRAGSVVDPVVSRGSGSCATSPGPRVTVPVAAAVPRAPDVALPSGGVATTAVAVPRSLEGSGAALAGVAGRRVERPFAGPAVRAGAGPGSPSPPGAGGADRCVVDGSVMRSG